MTEKTTSELLGHRKGCSLGLVMSYKNCHCQSPEYIRGEMRGRLAVILDNFDKGLMTKTETIDTIERIFEWGK